MSLPACSATEVIKHLLQLRSNLLELMLLPMKCALLLLLLYVEQLL